MIDEGMLLYLFAIRTTQFYFLLDFHININGPHKVYRDCRQLNGTL